MARVSEPPLASLLTAVVRTSLQDIAHWSWRPHRVFNDKPEPLTSYHARLEKLYEASQYGSIAAVDELMLQVCQSALNFDPAYCLN